MRVNNCLPLELISVYCPVNKQGGIYNIPLFTGCFFSRGDR